MNCSPEFCLCYLLIFIFPITSYVVIETRSSALKCRLNMLKPVWKYEYYQEGDVIIGGLVSAHIRIVRQGSIEEGTLGWGNEPVSLDFCEEVDLEEYRCILAMILAVNEINKNPDLLPNVTLGYHIFSTCSDPMKTIGYATKILSGENEAPNYYCKGHGEVAGFIGDGTFHTNHALAQLLSLHRYTQITYRATDLHLSDVKIYPTLFRMIPDDWVRFAAIIKLLKYLEWNWVGILTAWDGSGDEEAQELRKKMSQHGICTDYIVQFTHNEEGAFQRIRIISKSAAKVIIVCGIFTPDFYYFISQMPSVIETITFIFPPSWSKLSCVTASCEALIKYSFIFIWSPNEIPNIERYENGVNFSSCPNDPILEDIGLYAFHCLSSNKLKNYRLQLYNEFSAERCTDVKNVLPFLVGFAAMLSYAYKAVYVMGNALHAMYMEKHKSEQNRLQRKEDRLVTGT
ncbi:vomeronasal type-2 receptor 1-like [Lithobates pipiens]